MKEPKTKIALTLYNLRNQCTRESELDSTLNTISQMGFQAVQVSGIPWANSDLIAEKLDKYNLHCCATHENLASLEHNPEEVVEKLISLGCSYAALGHPGNGFWKPGGAKELAGILEKASAILMEADITLGYHNHHVELVRFENRTFLEDLFDLTKQDVHGELDLHWIARAGGDPAWWIRRMKNRARVIHFKDMAMRYSEGNNAHPVYAEIGEGNLNWTEIIEACEYSGTRWYVIEQDEPSGERGIFASMELSLKNLKQMGIQ